MTKIKRGCPFCGILFDEPTFSRSALIPPGSGHVTLDSKFSTVHPENIGYSVMCPNFECGMEGPVGSDRDQAIQKWNDRI